MFGKPKRTPLLVLLVLAGTGIFFSQAQAMVKDSDADGLTDQGETTLYLTDSQNSDTDNDNFSDSDEILASSNPLNTESVPSQMTKPEITPPLSRSFYVGLAISVFAFFVFGLIGLGLLRVFRKNAKLP